MTAIGFARGHWLVRWATSSKVGHCFIIDGQEIITATAAGIQLAAWDPKRWDLIQVIDPKVDMSAGIAWARGEVGVPYAWETDAKIALRILVDRCGFGRPASPKPITALVPPGTVKQAAGLNCSWLCAEALRRSGYPIGTLDPSGCDPDELWKLMRAGAVK